MMAKVKEQQMPLMGFESSLIIMNVLLYFNNLSRVTDKKMISARVVQSLTLN